MYIRKAEWNMGDDYQRDVQNPKIVLRFTEGILKN